MQRITRITILLGLGLACAPSPAHACGPSFSRSLLSAGDDALCNAPPLDFDALLGALEDRSSDATPNTLDTLRAAEIDLRAALANEGRSAIEIERVVAAWSSYREHIGELDEPDFPMELPEEFALYLRGARAWHRDDHPRAESHFEALLELPAARRQHRSVWAAYMLGRMASSGRCRLAARRFEQTRALVAEGFADTLGLGPASWGEQAGCLLRSAEPGAIPWTEVIGLYLRQHEAGDASAAGSLREVAELALAESIEDPKLLGQLARAPESRATISAYLAAHPQLVVDRGHAARWLDALEAEPELPTRGAGSLAWIAYQASDMRSAERWARLAPAEDPLARWVAAKLLLRTGTSADMARAREQLEALERDLADASDAPDIGVHDWRVGIEGAGIGPSAAADEAMLAMRGDRFVDALAALLRARSWVDAAYLAEQVLTIDELREFVDALPEQDSGQFEDELRWLLARRLARANLWTDALPYYPAELRREAERMRDDLERGDDLDQPAPVRARALWQAGKRTRELGMELRGTEIEPDWHYYAGDYSPPAIGEQRLEFSATLTRPSDEERSRVAHHFDRELPRFHYRSRAAALGEEAAALLPDDHEAGARVLCQAAQWIHVRDFEGADRLIRRMKARNPNIGVARQGHRLLDKATHAACSLEGIDFAAPAFSPPPPPAPGLDLLRRAARLAGRKWPLGLGLGLTMLLGLVMLGRRRQPTGPGTRSP